MTGGQVHRRTPPRAGGQIHAVLRGRDGVVRVWRGAGGAAEDFTLAEARALCRAGDAALLLPVEATGHATMWAGSDWLTVERGWLVQFLAVVRRALRTDGAARVMAAKAPARASAKPEIPARDSLGGDRDGDPDNNGCPPAGSNGARRGEAYIAAVNGHQRHDFSNGGGDARRWSDPNGTVFVDDAAHGGSDAGSWAKDLLFARLWSLLRKGVGA